jgi:hypothetical protein
MAEKEAWQVEMEKQFLKLHRRVLALEQKDPDRCAAVTGDEGLCPNKRDHSDTLCLKHAEVRINWLEGKDCKERMMRRFGREEDG